MNRVLLAQFPSGNGLSIPRGNFAQADPPEIFDGNWVGNRKLVSETLFMISIPLVLKLLQECKISKETGLSRIVKFQLQNNVLRWQVKIKSLQRQCPISVDDFENGTLVLILLNFGQKLAIGWLFCKYLIWLKNLKKNCFG